MCLSWLHASQSDRPCLASSSSSASLCKSASVYGDAESLKVVLQCTSIAVSDWNCLLNALCAGSGNGSLRWQQELDWQTSIVYWQAQRLHYVASKVYGSCYYGCLCSRYCTEHRWFFWREEMTKEPKGSRQHHARHC